MKSITKNGVSFSLPTNWMEVTIQQWVDWWNAHGKGNDETYKAIEAITDAAEQARQYFEYYKSAIADWVAFYGNVDKAVIQALYTPTELTYLYGECVGQMEASQVNDLLEGGIITWNGEQWKLAPPVISGNNTVQDEETVTDVALLFSDWTNGKAEALPELCAAYLRHPDEPYSDELIFGESERRKLMYTLPMSYANQVKSFVEITLHAAVGNTDTGTE